MRKKNEPLLYKNFSVFIDHRLNHLKRKKKFLLMENETKSTCSPFVKAISKQNMFARNPLVSLIGCWEGWWWWKNVKPSKHKTSQNNPVTISVTFSSVVANRSASFQALRGVCRAASILWQTRETGKMNTVNKDIGDEFKRHWSYFWL